MWNEIFCSFVIYCVYVCCGAALFHNMMYEESIDASVNQNHSIEWNKIKSILHEHNYTDERIAEGLENLRIAKSLRFIDEGNITGLVGHSWTLFNAFFFCLTLTSTIGYGHVSPQTTHGRIIVIAYIIIGIPVHIVFTKVLSDLFTENLQMHEWKSRCERCSQAVNTVMSCLTFCTYWFFVLFMIPTVIFWFTEPWWILEGLYYCYITLTTIGLGDYVAGNLLRLEVWYYLYKILIVVWLLYGLTFVAMITNYCTQFFQNYTLFMMVWKRGSWKLKLTRVNIQTDRMDIHFRYFRSLDANRPRRSHAFSVREVTSDDKVAEKAHLNKIIDIIDAMQQDIRYELGKMQRQRATFVNSIVSSEDPSRSKPT